MTTQAPFHRFDTSFPIVKASNVIASFLPIKLTDVKLKLFSSPAPQLYLDQLVLQLWVQVWGMSYRIKNSFCDTIFDTNNNDNLIRYIDSNSRKTSIINRTDRQIFFTIRVMTRRFYGNLPDTLSIADI
ncbi:hypothetical protein QUA81_19160 [Microcoleus sp. F6_B4]